MRRAPGLPSPFPRPQNSLSAAPPPTLRRRALGFAAPLPASCPTPGCATWWRAPTPSACAAPRWVQGPAGLLGPGVRSSPHAWQPDGWPRPLGTMRMCTMQMANLEAILDRGELPSSSTQLDEGQAAAVADIYGAAMRIMRTPADVAAEVNGGGRGRGGGVQGGHSTPRCRAASAEACRGLRPRAGAGADRRSRGVCHWHGVTSGR